ncbi:MAG: putative quinol monooxygenase [Bacteroidales bacterium]|jgi:quinol monooxygenase YgiN|nr:putative quinol monooxygenase [Bacteroidales bacterium]
MKRVIIAQLSIKEEHINTFLKLAEVMVDSSNQETGCICYKLLNALKTKGEFFFYEEYIDADAIVFHNASKHFKAFSEAIAPLLTKDPVIDVF